jgi:hypothetical protein
MKTQKQLTQPILITNDNILWAALHLKNGLCVKDNAYAIYYHMNSEGKIGAFELNKQYNDGFCYSNIDDFIKCKSMISTSWSIYELRPHWMPNFSNSKKGDKCFSSINGDLVIDFFNEIEDKAIVAGKYGYYLNGYWCHDDKHPTLFNSKQQCIDYWNHQI